MNGFSVFRELKHNRRYAVQRRRATWQGRDHDHEGGLPRVRLIHCTKMQSPGKICSDSEEALNFAASQGHYSKTTNYDCSEKALSTEATSHRG